MRGAHGGLRVTDAIAAITVAAWVIATFGVPAAWLAEQAGFVPLRISGHFGGMLVPALLTPLSATLVHGGLLHLVMNMVSLIFCGRIVESVIGRAPIAVLYIIGAYGAAAAQFLADRASPVPMIGASGAISAVIAVYALLFSRNEVKAIGPIPSHWVRALWLALAWTVLNGLIGVTTAGGPSPVAAAAHIGGFLIGLALARPLLAWRYRSA
jgi:membrane associated rhomboid family serine protease